MENLKQVSKKITNYTLEELVITLHERTKNVIKQKIQDPNTLKENMLFALDLIKHYDVGDEEFFELAEKLNNINRIETDYFLISYEAIKKNKSA